MLHFWGMGGVHIYILSNKSPDRRQFFVSHYITFQHSTSVGTLRSRYWDTRLLHRGLVVETQDLKAGCQTPAARQPGTGLQLFGPADRGLTGRQWGAHRNLHLFVNMSNTCIYDTAPLIIPPRWQSAEADWSATVFLAGGKWIDSVLQREVRADIEPEGFWLKNNRIRPVGLAGIAPPLTWVGTRKTMWSRNTKYIFQNWFLKYLIFSIWNSMQYWY